MTRLNLNRQANFDNIMARSLPPLDFVLPGLLSETVGIVVSAGGVGKSYFMLETALSIAIGQDLFGFWGEDPAPGPVVYVNLEDPSLAINHREMAMGRFLEELHEWSGGPDPWEFDWELVDKNLHICSMYREPFAIAELNESGVPQITDTWHTFIADMEELSPRLTIFDTLNRGISTLDENSSGHMREVVRALEQLATKVGCATLALHHVNKQSMLSGTGAEQQAIRGSSALSDNARWQANLMRMTKKDGESRGYSDEERRKWIQLDIPKISYGPDKGTNWLARCEGGILTGHAEPAAPKTHNGNGDKKKGFQKETRDEG